MQHRLQALAQPRALRLLALLPVVVAATLAAGCGDKSKSEGKASQAAARVDGSEITVHQINQVLERQPGLRPEQADAAGRQVLEGLIDQQLAVAKAEEQKLDRDPQVLALLEATRRNILARTYMEKASVAGTTPPTGDEVRKYFDAKPALFSQRKVYALQEFTVPATPEQSKALIEKLKTLRSAGEYAEAIKAAGLKFNTNQVTQGAEGLPMAIVEPLSKISNGESLFLTAKDGFKALLVIASKDQPVGFEQAKPAIEQYLTVERRREFAQKAMKDMRAAAKIEYIGKFAEKPASGAAAAASAASTPSALAPIVPSSPTEAASTALDAAAVTKGLSGLK
ncbi:MAG: peptidyl-prolyl cis-trans isomerase, EpsD family [Proteobacteria bacterium]|uniref:EpsD family peptidyl-prolyl cis-trans isomerase n=1 Tax=Aquabacterium sp. TaxID=1872578 RepID=UPI0035C740D3|nr:peptidyl-prolyl cis-trans isomerase, EpsD family [Pseudomonadota bacterium]